jgi:hypothetical protein
MVRQACANAEVRARRAAYEAYSAEIIDITPFLPARDAEGNTPEAPSGDPDRHEGRCI